MKRIKIIKDGIVTNINNDTNQTDAEKDAWLHREIQNGSFGKPQRWLAGTLLSDEEKAKAIASRTLTDLGGIEITEYELPAEFEIVEEDMTAEIAQKEADEAEEKQAREFLKGVKRSELTTVAKCADAIMRIIKHLRADK